MAYDPALNKIIDTFESTPRPGDKTWLRVTVAAYDGGKVKAKLQRVGRKKDGEYTKDPGGLLGHELEWYTSMFERISRAMDKE